MRGDPWDNKQDFMLATCIRDKFQISVMARFYGRGEGAMTSRAEHLCLTGRSAFFDWRAENRVLARWYQSYNPERYVLPKMQRSDLTKPRIRIK